MGGAGSQGAARKMLALVFMCNVVDFFLLTVVIPLFPIELEGQGRGPMQIGLLFASKSVAQLLFAPVSATIVHRWGPARPLVAGILVILGSTLTYVFTIGNYAGMMIARSVQGFGSNMVGTAGMSALAIMFSSRASDDDDDDDDDGKGNRPVGAGFAKGAGDVSAGSEGEGKGRASDDDADVDSIIVLPRLNNRKGEHGVSSAEAAAADGRAEAIGTSLGGVGIGVLSGPPMGSWLVRYGGRVPYFATVGIVGVILLVACAILSRPEVHLRLSADARRRRRSAPGAGDGKGVPLLVSSGMADHPHGGGGGGGGGVRGDINGPGYSDGGNRGAVDDVNDYGDDGGSLASTLSVLKDGEVLCGFTVLLILNAAIGMNDPIIPLLAADPPFNVPETDTGFIFVSTTVTYSLATPLAGLFNERTGLLYWQVAAGLVVTAAATALLTVPQTTVGLIAVLASTGVGVAMVDATIPAILAAATESRHVGRFGTLFALLDVAFSAGFALGPIAGTSVAEKFGFHATFFSFSAVCIATVPIVWLGAHLGVKAERARGGPRQGLLDNEIGSW